MLTTTPPIVAPAPVSQRTDVPRGPRYRVLLSAYACGPGRGSEPGVGWHTARAVAAHHDVWVLTTPENQDAIREELRARPVPSLRVVVVGWPAPLSTLATTRVTGELQYRAWQHAVLPVARRLHADVGFDVAHHVTYCRYWTPSALAQLPVPFIWGPVGGGESAPPSFVRHMRFQARLGESLRDLARAAGQRDPGVRRTVRRAVRAVATTPETATRLRALGARHVEVFSQLGLPEDELAHLGALAPPPDGPVRFLSSGRLVAWKGIHLGLHAFATLRDLRAEYWVVGDGPERDGLRQLADRLSLGDRVRFLGSLARPEALGAIASCHALLHPSLHESGGMVCLEAMAAGRPVVCLALGGPALVVTPETGIRVPAATPETSISALGEAMRQLARDPSRAAVLGAAARARAQTEFAWPARAWRYDAWYREAAEGRTGMPRTGGLG